MEKISELIKEKGFLASAEIIPPRNGEDSLPIFQKLETIVPWIDFVSVTKGAGGSLRGGTLPLSWAVQARLGINTVAHFVCREHTKFEIENELSDLNYFGIRNILALRGDPPAGQGMAAWDGDYHYSYLLAEQIRRMNQGAYLPRSGVDQGQRQGCCTDFCILVAGHPEDPPEDEAMHMQCKVDAGAEAVITQMVFSFSEYRRYVEGLRKARIRIPVIAGIRPLTSLKQAESVEQYFKIPVAAELKDLLSGAKGDQEARLAGIEYIRDMVKRLKGFGAPGVHLFVLQDIGIIKEILA